MYYFLQLLVNLSAFDNLKITCNVSEVLDKIKGIVYIKIATEPIIVKFIKNNLDKKFFDVYDFLFSGGPFLTCIFSFCIFVVFIALLTIIEKNFKVVGDIKRKLLKWLLWKPVFRGTITMYYPAMLVVFEQLKKSEISVYMIV